MKRKIFLRTFTALMLCAAMLTAGAAALTDGAVVTVKTAVNSAPIAKNLEYTTYRGVPLNGVFDATDPDGDAVVFRLATMPKYGEVETSGDTGFVYTPAGKKSSDSFTYTAVDALGNVSQEATVEISIKKQTAAVMYSDMKEHPSGYAAIRLAETGIFTGKQLGSEFLFEPDAPVSRGEFLTMCLAACGVTVLDGVERTGFGDDDIMPSWAKPYVSAALLDGYVSGYENDEGQIVFSAEDTIKMAEAAVMLNNVLEISDVVQTAAMDSGLCPVWAQQATVNLASCGVVNRGGDYYAELTRADAAEMLCSALDVMEARETGGIFSWFE